MAKILVVDDEEAIRILLAQIMEMGGYAYSLAANAKEARTSLKNQNIDRSKYYGEIWCHIW